MQKLLRVMVALVVMFIKCKFIVAKIFVLIYMFMTKLLCWGKRENIAIYDALNSYLLHVKD